MACDTNLREHDVCDLERGYGLTIHRCEAMEQGASNASYRVEALEGSFVVTLFEGLSPAGVETLGRLLQHLEAHDFPTSRVRSAVAGRLVLELGGRPVLVKTFIEGQIRPDPGTALLRHVGQTLARLHEIPPPPWLPDRHDYDRLLDTLEAGGVDPLYEQWLEARRPGHAAGSVDLPTGLVHGDFFLDNVLVRGEEVVASIDFEDACRYPLVYDLSMVIVGLCSRGEEVSLVGARALVAGYQEVRSLSMAERTALQGFVEAAAIGTSVWRFWKYRCQADVADKAERHWEMARCADTVASIPAGHFQRAVFGESMGLEIA